MKFLKSKSLIFFLLLVIIVLLSCLIFFNKKDGPTTNSTNHPSDLTINSSALPTPTLSATHKEEVTPTPTPAPTPCSARIIMVGDVLMHDDVINSGKNGADYNFDHLFTNISQEIASSDIAIVNQEVIIAGSQYGIDGYPYFNAPIELIDSIAHAGFDIILHASNHTLDKGKEAMLSSLAYWRKNFPKVSVIGMHDSVQDTENITIKEINGIKFAFLNYTYGLNPAGEKYINKDPFLVDVLIESKVKSDIARAEALADITIVAVHWGTEYSFQPSKTQKNWANIFLNSGVDLVLGTHPHVIQPVEWLENSNGQRMLVYWSLGNFVNCTSSRGSGVGARMLGAMSDVTFIKNDDGSVTIQNAVAHGLITHIDYKQYGITTYLFKNYTEALFNKNKTSDMDPDFSYNYCVETFNSILGAFYAG